MSSDVPRAAADHSRSTPIGKGSSGAASTARAALVVAGFAGAIALVVATFTPIIEITVGGEGNIAADVDRSLSGLDRHSVALLLVAGLAGALHVGALRGSRPAMAAVAALGALALAIAILSDVPDLDRTGQIGELYEEASASAGAGFYFETLGGALLLAAGGGLLVLSGARPAPAADRSSPRERADDRPRRP